MDEDRLKDPMLPHVRQRDSNRWRQWKHGYGICVLCERDWVPREGKGLLLPHLTTGDAPCPCRRAK